MSTETVSGPPPADTLRKLHVEVTTRCNLDCAMCQRHVWDEPDADMAPETFEALVRGLGEFPGEGTLQFSGFGEPLVHPRIVDLVRTAPAAGLATEVVTNGALLSRDLGTALIIVVGTSMGVARGLLSSERFGRWTAALKKVAGATTIVVGIYFLLRAI